MKNVIIILILVQLLVSGISACTTNCNICTNTNCTACISGYYLSSGNCLVCVDPNCDTCDSNGTLCTVCKSGYGLRINDSLCVSCNISIDFNCVSGTNSAVCNEYALNGYG